MQLMVEGLKICVKLCTMRLSVSGEIAPGVPCIATIEDYIRQTCGTVASCWDVQMGIDQMAVVDPQLKVRGLKGYELLMHRLCQL